MDGKFDVGERKITPFGCQPGCVRTLWANAWTIALAATVCATWLPAVGQPAPPATSEIADKSVEQWMSSPFHGAISGATGKPIPCLCRFRGQDFKLGDRVCMQTPDGIVMTRCDMHLNNTTWIPTDQPCTMSMRPSQPRQIRQS